MEKMHQQSRDGSESSPNRLRTVVLVAIMILGLGYLVVREVTQPDQDSAIAVDEADVRKALDDGRFDDAEAMSLTAAQDGRVEMWLYAAQAAVAANRLADAERYWSELSGVGGQLEALAEFARGDQKFKEGALTSALESYRKATTLDPTNTNVRQRLVYTYAMSGQTYLVRPHSLYLLKNGQHFETAIGLLADADAVLNPPREMATSTENADTLLVLGHSRRTRKMEGNEAAAEVVAELMSREDRPISAYCEIGMLWEQQPELLRTWLANSPPGIESVPDYWYLAGRVAESDGRENEALWCFLQSLERQPDHLRATYAIGQIAVKLGLPETAEIFSARAEKIQKLASYALKAYTAPSVAGWKQQLSLLSEELGRYWEAVAWAEACLKVDPKSPLVRGVLQRTIPKIRPDLPLIAPAHDPLQHVDRSIARQWTPEHESPRNLQLVLDSLRPGKSDDSKRLADSVIEYAKFAEQSGLNFVGIQRTDVEETGRRMQEMSGTGVSVIDYDNDDRPDLFFPQSSLDENGRFRPITTADGDKLFRNRTADPASTKFSDDTHQSGLIIPGHGQGATAGDFDSDGFADLYVAHAGKNFLFINNGDGTFRDASSEVGIKDTAWTTSAVIADINGDTFADIYDVNYLQGDDVYERICQNADGIKMSCTPLGFPPAPDALLAGTGTYRVDDISASSGVADGKGNGLGIVVGEFASEPGLEIFVANDLTSNHFFVADTTQDRYSLADEALFRGLSYNRYAEPEACMGVAAGDSDQDGQIDLFVTNFYEETNTLYRAIEDGRFSDDTSALQLSDPGRRLMGFGTQFMDMDLDGLEDIVMTNGHVDRQPGIPYRMTPLVFRNTGSGFDPVPNETIGPYFTEEYLGRGLARADFNGDGLDDFVVTHLDEAAELLIGQTQTPNRSLKLSLVGTRAHRDAIGTTVRCELVNSNGERRKLTRQLTAGDGYECSNERVLTFGVRPEERIEFVEVIWTGQATDAARYRPDAGQRITILQGSPTAFSF